MPFKIMLFTSILGGLSGLIGGLLSVFIKIKNKNVLASLFEVTAGIMTGIVCFEILPECFEMSNVLFCITGVVIGVFIIYKMNNYVQKHSKYNKQSNYSLIFIVIMISMTFHNLIEGLAIGSSMMYSTKLGITLLISIMLHDIPEGMVVGIISKADNQSNRKILLNSIVSGMFTGIGAFLGVMIGKISKTYISICLCIAAGAMLYIVSCDLIPSSKEISKSKKVYIVYIMGILVGAIISKI